MLGRHCRWEKCRRALRGTPANPISPSKDRTPSQHNTPSKSQAGLAATSPFPPDPSTPTLTPMSTRTRALLHVPHAPNRRSAPTSFEGPTPSTTQLPKLRVQGRALPGRPRRSCAVSDSLLQRPPSSKRRWLTRLAACFAPPLRSPCFLSGGCSEVVSLGICLIAAPRGSNPPLRFNLQPATRSDAQNHGSKPSCAAPRRHSTSTQPQSCTGLGSGGPRHGPAGKNARKRNESNQISPLLQRG